MSLACEFGVGAGVGLELVMLKNRFKKKPRRVISSGEQGSCLGASSWNSEHCRIHQGLWGFSGEEVPTRVTISPQGSCGPLAPQSMDEAGVPWPWPVCVGGTGSSLPAYPPGLTRVGLSWWALAVPQQVVLPVPTGLCFWVTSSLGEYVAMGRVPVP